jgi:hypothetical protein
MSKRSFEKRVYPCADCTRDVTVRSVFGHFATVHDETLVRRRRDGTDKCALCRFELPDTDENHGWRRRIRHFRDDHGKRLLDVNSLG